jgi:glycosyltransferase 2 family protein
MRIKDALVGQSKKNWLGLIPGILISVASLAILLYFTDLDKFLDALRLADYRFVTLLFSITLVWLAVRSIVWRTLLREQATYGQVFLTLNEGYLLNNLLPFRLGEVGRAFLLSKKANLGFLQVFSTILIERALDLAIAAGLLLVCLPFVVHTGFARQVGLITGGIVLLGLAALHILARNQDWAVQNFETLGRRIPIILKVIKDRQLKAFFAGLDALTNLQRFLKVIFWMFLNWGIALIQFYVLLRAFFPNALFLWAAFTLGVMAMGIAAPSSPGAIGVMEIAIVGALSVFHLEASVALAAALTAHLTNYLITGVIGIFALSRDGLTLTGLYRDVRQISPVEQEKPE